MVKVISRKKSRLEIMKEKRRSSRSSVSERSLPLSKELLRQMYSLMLKSRVLEERLIKIYKSGEAFFWIGAPGEEAFGVPLGLLVNKGRGPEYDWLHLHYRATPTLVAMGMPIIDSIRMMMNRITDPCTGGRNFSNHYCYPEWNVAPVSSPIEVQYSHAIGTAHVQARRKTRGLTVVTGGDAGSAEGDFATCLVWSSRKGNELPMLITVQNNQWGISTPYEGQHGEKFIADRGKAFGMRTQVINGNDPIETYKVLKSEMDMIRKTGKPSLVEARVSRLYGHSSASGANRVEGEEDCVKLFEEKLFRWGVMDEAEVKKMSSEYNAETMKVVEQVRKESAPKPESLWDHVYVGGKTGDWREF